MALKLRILDKEKKEIGEQELPEQFQEEVNSALALRAVKATQKRKRQKYGANKRAGLRASARISKRRRDYRGCYGHGISRVPRKILSRRGTRMYWVGARIPGTVGGRRAHPPKAEKKWAEKINDTERKKAIRTLLTAAMDKGVVKERGHKVPDNYPFILDKSVEEIKKTSQIKKLLIELGLEKELQRVNKTKIRAGKGKMRGRKLKVKKGPLIVVAGKCPLMKAARNIRGVEVVEAKRLSAEVLAPGIKSDIKSARMTLFTQPAIEILAKEKLYL